LILTGVLAGIKFLDAAYEAVPVPPQQPASRICAGRFRRTSGTGTDENYLSVPLRLRLPYFSVIKLIGPDFHLGYAHQHRLEVFLKKLSRGVDGKSG